MLYQISHAESEMTKLIYNILFRFLGQFSDVLDDLLVSTMLIFHYPGIVLSMDNLIFDICLSFNFGYNHILVNGTLSNSAINP